MEPTTTQSNLWIDQLMQTPFPSYHLPLKLARSLGRSREPECRKDAVDLLKQLVVRYPYALAIGQELVLVLMESGNDSAAELTLQRFEMEFRNLDEEFLCRWGRLFKDRGDLHSALPWYSTEEANPSLAEWYYRKSLEKYAQAYEIRHGYYPGINKATLLLILFALKSTDLNGMPLDRSPGEWSDLAMRILESRPRWKIEQDDDLEVWFPATMGEAHLLRQEWSDSAGFYRQALKSKRLTAHAKESMRRQVSRVLTCFKSLEVPIAEPLDKINSLFDSIAEPVNQPLLPAVPQD